VRHRREAVQAATAPTEAAFRAAVAGLSADWNLVEPDEVQQITALRARCADLVIMPTPVARHDAGLAETMIQHAGVPCLIAPDSAATASPERVVIAWNGSREARRAVGAAMSFLRQAKAVEIVTASARIWPGPESLGESLATALARHGVTATLFEAPHPGGSRDQLILDRCAAFEAGLLVMGAFGHARASEDLFGGTTRTVLLSGALPVLMSH
jgi:nucleotide-binding universal stress UspA family protein